MVFASLCTLYVVTDCSANFQSKPQYALQFRFVSVTEKTEDILVLMRRYLPKEAIHGAVMGVEGIALRIALDDVFWSPRPAVVEAAGQVQTVQVLLGQIIIFP